MQQRLTVIVPFWNGHGTIERLLNSLPSTLPVVIVDDVSDRPLTHVNRANTKIVRMPTKGYFSGAVNTGARACDGDFVIVNQDAWFDNDTWLKLVERNRYKYGTFGHGVMKHRGWPKGYVQGTFMFVRRDAWSEVGEFNEFDYPLWGATAEWQLRMCRAGYKAHPMTRITGFHHDEHRRRDRRRYGESITSLLRREGKTRRGKLLDTPPLMSVVIPCYNYGRYLEDAINSLIGGPTSLGDFPPQTFQSFEVIVVDDASTDDSWERIQRVVDDWKGIRAIRLSKNRGTPGCMNVGVNAAIGKYIHILSADDMREPYQLERLLRAAQNNPHSFAFSSVMTFKNGERLRQIVLPEYDFEKVISKNLVPAGIVYPKKAWEKVGGYPEIMVHGREDWAFNVGMGLHGWCGVKVEGFGNLYRRERQNRSWRTGNQHKGEEQSKEAAGWRKKFVEQMRSLYPKIYAGVRPVGCCGSRKVTRGTSRSAPAKKQVVQLPGQSGMVILEYVGGKAGSQTFFGEVTRTRYVFGNSRKRGYVAKEDAPSLLALSRNRKKQFVSFIPPKIKEPEPPVPDDIATYESEETDDLTELSGVGPAIARNLVEGGYDTIKSISDADPIELSDSIKGVTLSRAMALVQSAQEMHGNA